MINKNHIEYVGEIKAVRETEADREKGKIYEGKGGDPKK